jgi:LPXTG-site transpeptidase (sortase) family protein
MPGRTTRRAAWVALAVVVLATGLVTGLVTTRGSRAATAVASQRPPAAGAPVAQTPAPPAPDAWWKPLPRATAAFVPARLVIERLKVQATIEVKGIDAHNVMEAPDKGTDAAWYRFTAQPGAGSNAVFAGHRDFGQVGNPAIFWHLDQLVAGDMVDVVSTQQTEIRYRVTKTWDYGVQDIPMDRVLATDRVEEVTLITCSGSYSRGLGYDHRLVVRAVRVA